MFERGDLVESDIFRERNLRGLVDRRYLVQMNPAIPIPADVAVQEVGTPTALAAPRGVPVAAQGKGSQDAPKRRGRPPGSKNRASEATSDAGV